MTVKYREFVCTSAIFEDSSSGNFGLLDKVKEDLSVEKHLSDDEGSASIDLFLQVDHLLVPQGDRWQWPRIASDSDGCHANLKHHAVRFCQRYSAITNSPNLMTT